MLLGGNLVSFFGALVVAVVWLVARWKWRCAVARRKEITRLMALASAEAIRAELEANTGYISYGSVLGPEPVVEEPVIGSGSGSSPQSPLQSRCEVCFSPTTTRCKQCKAVHYCVMTGALLPTITIMFAMEGFLTRLTSGKCQITHWRQGHKDECFSLIARQKIDPGVHPHLKDLNEEVTGSIRNDTRIKGIVSSEPIELPSEENLFHDSDSQIFNGTNATGSKTSHDERRGNMNIPEDTLPKVCSKSTTSILFAVAAINKLKDVNGIHGQGASMDFEPMEPLLSGQPSPTKPGHCTSANAPDEKSEFSTSSSYSIADSEGHSLSEPSKHSYGFWGETVESINSNTEVIAEVGKFNMTSSHSSHLLSASGVDTHAKILVSDVNRVIAGGPSPSTLMPKESTDVAGLLEVSKDGFKSGELFPNSTLTGGNSLTSSSSCSSLEEESKVSSSCVLGNMCEGELPRKHALGGSNLHCLSHKQLDHEIGRKNGIFDTIKWQGNDSLRLRSSEAYLSASTCSHKPSFVDVKYVETELSWENAVSFLDKGGHLRTALGGADPLPRRVVDKNGTSNVIGMVSAVTGAGIIKRYEGSFPYEHFVKLYNWNEVELCPCGLINYGNSCYANAVLQCLTFTPPLTAYFLQGLHTKDCQRKEWCFSCEFEILVRKAKASKYPLSPARIMCDIDRMGSHLVHGREEDAHEFLRYAIDTMQLACLKEAGTKVPRYMDEVTTLFGLTFGGFLRSKIECMRCGGKSEQHERMMDLTVEIEGDIATLEDALRRFTHSEILDGENKYHCGRCKSYEKAKKKLRVLEAPNVLTIALKKFQTGKYRKHKRVKFHEILNIAPYMSGTSDTSPVYQLYGVVVHVDLLGAAFSGHYLCYVKDNQGRWFEANDSMVEEVGLEKVLSRDAYMLFYARCSPRAPRLIRSSVVPRDTRKATSPVDKFKSHPRDPWDVSAGDVNGSMANGYFHPTYTSRHPALSNLEEESLSDYSSSFFSDGGSYGTETSNGESTSTSEYFEQILGDMGNSSE